MNRAAVSIPSNIAEGAERDSKKEFIHFLNYPTINIRNQRNIINAPRPHQLSKTKTKKYLTLKT
jgi:four helix bundle protein